MSDVETVDLGAPNEVRTYPHGKLEIFQIGGQTFGRATYEPGWHWREEVGGGAEWCYVHHVGVALSGALHLRLEDGSEAEITSGRAYSIPPGHDGWVVSEEPWIAFDTVDPDQVSTVLALVRKR
jgi:hypothetical protein